MRFIIYILVSTHSRLKAAGFIQDVKHRNQYGFNTQPPKGGWESPDGEELTVMQVSTHSRLKAAGLDKQLADPQSKVSTHSRLKAAGFHCQGHQGQQ